MEKSATSRPSLQKSFTVHDRHWRDFDYVYPVLSRRSGGVSIGINLNPGQGCNSNCVYCQVNRQEKPRRQDVDEDQLLRELGFLLDFSGCGEIFQTPEFFGVPAMWRRVNDVAFSGDGEPTSYPRFAAVVSRVAELLKEKGFVATPAHGRCLDGDRGGRPTSSGIKIVLITNATLLHRPNVQEALRIMDENNGEVWAKLDAGTEGYYRRINRSLVPFRRVLANILSCAQARPTVIQSLFLKIHGQGPTSEEIEAYGRRLQDIVAQGGRIKGVQVYTVARRPAEKYVSLLGNVELDGIAAQVREILPDVPVEVYYGAG